MDETPFSAVRSRWLAALFAGIAGALLVATLLIAALSGFPSRLLPSIGWGVGTAFVLPGLALSLLVDAAVLAARGRAVTLNELTLVRVVGVITGILFAFALLEAGARIPGLELLLLAVYATMTALAVLVIFALFLTFEITMQTIRSRRVDASRAG